LAFADTFAVTLKDPLAVACACAGAARHTITPNVAIALQTAFVMITAPVRDLPHGGSGHAMNV
jgi:hypothetical protein